MMAGWRGQILHTGRWSSPPSPVMRSPSHAARSDLRPRRLLRRLPPAQRRSLRPAAHRDHVRHLV